MIANASRGIPLPTPTPTPRLLGEGIPDEEVEPKPLEVGALNGALSIGPFSDVVEVGALGKVFRVGRVGILGTACLGFVTTTVETIVTVPRAMVATLGVLGTTAVSEKLVETMIVLEGEEPQLLGYTSNISLLNPSTFSDSE